MQRTSIRTLKIESNANDFKKAYPFKALIKSRLFEDVADQIKEAIFNGAIKPGESLPSERQLCELFQVGRPTIREALRTLSVLGLIEVSRGQKGSVVRDYDIAQYINELRKQLSYLIHGDKDTLKELWEVRKYLEWGVARSAAENANGGDFKRIAQLVKKMEACGRDIEAYYPIGTEFHRQLAAATKNKIFYMIWEMIHEVLLKGYIPLLKDMFPDGPKKLLKANKVLFEAIKSRDSQAIDQAVAIHAEDENVFLK